MQSKLVCILKNNHRAEIWVSCEYRNGPAIVFAEQETNRSANEFRKPRRPLVIKAGGIPDLIDGLTKTADELRAKGMLPPLKSGARQ